jgi:hypothetical protein
MCAFGGRVKHTSKNLYVSLKKRTPFIEMAIRGIQSVTLPSKELENRTTVIHVFVGGRAKSNHQVSHASPEIPSPSNETARTASDAPCV